MILIDTEGDGRCIFEVAKASTVSVGVASMRDLRIAATNLRATCLANGSKIGGIAVGIGASGSTC